MPEKIVHIATNKAQHHLGKLCRKFSSIPKTGADPAQATITFPTGTCHIDADDAQLTLQFQAADMCAVLELQKRVVLYLLECAAAEPLVITWCSDKKAAPAHSDNYSRPA